MIVMRTFNKLVFVFQLISEFTCIYIFIVLSMLVFIDDLHLHSNIDIDDCSIYLYRNVHTFSLSLSFSLYRLSIYLPTELSIYLSHLSHLSDL